MKIIKERIEFSIIRIVYYKIDEQLFGLSRLFVDIKKAELN